MADLLMQCLKSCQSILPFVCLFIFPPFMFISSPALKLISCLFLVLFCFFHLIICLVFCICKLLYCFFNMRNQIDDLITWLINCQNSTHYIEAFQILENVFQKMNFQKKVSRRQLHKPPKLSIGASCKEIYNRAVSQIATISLKTNYGTQNFTMLLTPHSGLKVSILCK